MVSHTLSGSVSNKIFTFFRSSFFIADDYVGGRECSVLFVVDRVFNHVRGAVYKSVRSPVETKQAIGHTIVKDDIRFNTIRKNQKIIIKTLIN